jgi:hypothetical protein
MFVKKNRKNRTWFVGHRNPDKISVFYSVSFKNEKRGSKLTIVGENGKRVELDGRQISVLRKILDKGTSARNWNTK